MKLLKRQSDGLYWSEKHKRWVNIYYSPLHKRWLAARDGYVLASGSSKGEVTSKLAEGDRG